MDVDNKEIIIARNYLEKGNLAKSLELLEKLKEKHFEIVGNDYLRCKNLLLCKCFGQKNYEKFSSIAKNDRQYFLEKALLSGNEELKNLSLKNIKESFLAQCLLFPSLKDAFFYMRQNLAYKHIAEGWLCVLKNDTEKAISYFSGANENLKRAKIGIATALLFNNNFAKAQEIFSGFYDSLKKISPFLSKILGWDGSKNIGLIILEHKLYSLIRKGTIEELKKNISESQTINNVLKGYLYLRLGDKLNVNKDNTCITMWSKAKDYNPKLVTDVLKRYFLHYFYNNDDLAPSACIDLYYHLYKTNKNLAKTFFNKVTCDFYSPVNSLGYLPIPFFTKQQRWEKNPPPCEAAFFYLKKVSFEAESLLLTAQSKTLMPLIKKHCLINNFDKSIFNLLDSNYAASEAYLNFKINISRALDLHKEEREGICAILELNPNLKDTLLPYFVRAVLYDVNSSRALEEVKFLLNIFADNFDLVFLYLYLSSKHILTAKIENAFSENLLLVLKSQVNFYKGFLDKDFYKIDFDFSRDKEANWRYLRLLLRNDKIPVRFFKDVILKISSANNELLLILKKIFSYGFFPLPAAFQKAWKAVYSLNWGILFYDGLSCFRQEKIEMGIISFLKAFKKFDENDMFSYENSIMMNTLNLLAKKKQEI